MHSLPKCAFGHTITGWTGFEPQQRKYPVNHSLKEALRMEFKDLTEKIIGCAYRVYNKMGFGFLESVYRSMRDA